MIWIVIIIVLAAAFGPISRMMPTPRERQLSALRLKARSCGLVVEIRRLVYADPKPEHRVSAGGKLRDKARDCAAYSLFMDSPDREIPAWQLLKTVEEDGYVDDSPIKGWKWQVRAKMPQTFWQAMKTHMASLPDDCLSLEVSAGKVTCYWQEKTTPEKLDETVEAIALTLHSMAMLINDSLVSAE
ncbi:MAG: hypothetical protein KUG75_09575 [Pseudomonadales bacterium]|nr:hypothetical protein [Pseudomonadales bacterium]